MKGTEKGVRMSDDKPLPFARGTLPDRDRFTVSDALDLMAESVRPVDWEGGSREAQADFVARRDHHHRPALQRAIDAGQLAVFDTSGQQLWPMSAAALERAIIMRDDLQRFARDCLRIELVHEAAEAAHGAAGEPGTVKRWTPERVSEAWEYRRSMERQGEKAPMRRTAEHYGVSPQMLRRQFDKHGMRESSPAPLLSDWPAARRKVHRSR